MNKKISYIFIGSLILFAFFCTLQMGMTSDVLFYYELGKERLDYLLSFGSEKVSDTITAKKFLPGAYSTISAFLVQLFPRYFLIESIYTVNLIFSLFTLLGIFKLFKELFNETIGKISCVLCFFNPIFFGHMAINGIDTIIVFSNIWFFFCLLMYFKNYNDGYKKNNYIVLCGIFLGLGIGTRIAFLATIVPFILFLLIVIILKSNLVPKKFSFKAFFIDVIKLFLISYFFVVLFWPETHENIFLLPIKLVLESFSFGFGVPLILLNGDVYLSDSFPRSYLLTNFFYKMPEFIIISLLFFLFIFFNSKNFFKKRFDDYYLKIFLIFSVIAFPNLILFLSPFSVYDGIRLFLYLIPFICIIPSLLIYYLVKNIKVFLNKAILSIIVILKVIFLYNFIILTPYQYVYLNSFTGKFSENYKKFENDYWGVSTKKLISKIKENKNFSGNVSVFSTCGIETNAQIQYLKKLDIDFKMKNNSEESDYIIMNNRIINDKQNLNNYNKAQTCFERFKGEEIVRIERRGLVISKIIKK